MSEIPLRHDAASVVNRLREFYRPLEADKDIPRSQSYENCTGGNFANRTEMENAGASKRN